jgi:anthranilate synthase/aminodeoxychorismate synthase-like glutamine amidotransferase
LLLIDNYDSFTFNLVQYFGELGAEVDVCRNDAASAEELLERRPAALVVSPGPGRPEAAGASVEAVRRFAHARIPVLGVCLGLQAIGAAFGARIVHARSIRHGKSSWIHHDGQGLFDGLPSPLEATRYHSLVVEEGSCPRELRTSARSEDGEVMALRHAELPVEGVQFHPESILTREGKSILRNFLGGAARGARA